jgi:hypothetical protein
VVVAAVILKMDLIHQRLPVVLLVLVELAQLLAFLEVARATAEAEEEARLFSRLLALVLTVAVTVALLL